jgi:cell division protein FtsW (lipid II flippase)
MVATVRHVTSSSGLRKFQTDGFLSDRVYLYEFFTHVFRESNEFRENHILLRDVNEFLPVSVLSTFVGVLKCAKFDMGDYHVMPLIFLFIVWFERISVEMYP